MAKAEKFTLSQASAPSSFPIFLVVNLYVNTNRSGLTKTEIKNLVKNTISPSQAQMSASSQEQLSSHSQLSKADVQAIVKTVQESMLRAYKTLGKSKEASRKRGDALMDRFLDEIHRQSKDSVPTMPMIMIL